MQPEIAELQKIMDNYKIYQCIRKLDTADLRQIFKDKDKHSLTLTTFLNILNRTGHWEANFLNPQIVASVH